MKKTAMITFTTGVGRTCIGDKAAGKNLEVNRNGKKEKETFFSKY